MKYYGRVSVTLIAIFVIVAWHASYFLIGQNSAYTFLIKDGFLKYDFIYTPLILPFFWFMGKKYDEARFYSERDPLTSLYNRRFVFRVFPELLMKADRNQGILNIFIVDIDNFKKINDTYGHELGDDVIRDVSNALLQSTSPSDLIARWGGDEFLVIMPRTGHGLNLSLPIDIDKDLSESARRVGVKITVSIGISTYPENAKIPNELIRIADERMYELKSGKKSENEAFAPI